MRYSCAQLFLVVAAGVSLAGCSITGIIPGMGYTNSLPSASEASSSETPEQGPSGAGVLPSITQPGSSSEDVEDQVEEMPPEAGYSIAPITSQLLWMQEKVRADVISAKTNSTLDKQIDSYTYRVQPRDTLSIVVWGDVMQTSLFRPMGSAGASAGDNASSPIIGFAVNPDGSLFFPYVGRINVAGETTEDIRAQITGLMKRYVTNPQITVDVAQFNSQKYSLAGAVMKPGLYPVTNIPVTVSQAISAAGGVINQVPNTITTGNTIPRPLGDLSHVLYVHDGKASILNLRMLYQHGDVSQDRLVCPGDVIQVPDDTFEQIHVLGEVNNPGNYPLDNGRLNLAQLLGDAGEMNLSTANTGRILVFRGAAQGQQIFWLDASSPDAMLLANKFELEPQDVVYVATAGLTSWSRVIAQILPTIESLYEAKVLVTK